LNTIINYLKKNRSYIYKVLLVFFSAFTIVYLLPKEGQFKYEFQKGKIWQYNTYFAPFDFSILKSDEQIKLDKDEIIKNFSPYYRADLDLRIKIFEDYKISGKKHFEQINNDQKIDSLLVFGELLLNEIYNYGVMPVSDLKLENKDVLLIMGNNEIPLSINQLFNPSNLFEFISNKIESTPFFNYIEMFNDLFFELIIPNISYDQKFSIEAKDLALSQILLSRGGVLRGELIIAQGEIVDEEQYQILNSLRNEFSLIDVDKKSSYIIITGYTVLILLLFLVLVMFLKKYRNSVYNNNRQLTLIFFNILIIISLSTIALDYNMNFIYALPICILPLVMKVFFDPRLALFVHIISVLLIGFIVPNSFEFAFLQIVAGIVSTQSISQFYRRANLFISVSQIIMVYLTAYLAFSIIQEGNFNGIKVSVIGYFMLNGLLILFVLPLIYIYEKVFTLVSDVSLFELSDTNSILLKELSEKAPGTFHHSLQVANLAEAAANEIDANSLLVRVGALYHDIGKMKQSNYYSENQIGNKSPHDELRPINSAKLIIDHVIEGVAIAKKNNLPKRIIDFIETHHGTSVVYYFYKKYSESVEEGYSLKEFQYPGPKPFSKETAILMMADSVEAGSKSLKNPDLNQLKNFVNKIISDKMDQKQFDSSDITLREIEKVKEVLFKKLINVYQLRIEYPE
jgi:putative nucleotidyltransferase with HDIG domain